MAIVRIPSLMRDLTGGRSEVRVNGETLGEVFGNLSKQFDGFEGRILVNGGLKPGVFVAIDGRISSLGILDRVRSESRIIILQTAGGG